MALVHDWDGENPYHQPFAEAAGVGARSPSPPSSRAPESAGGIRERANRGRGWAVQWGQYSISIGSRQMNSDSTVVLDVDEGGAGADMGDVSSVLSAMAAEHQRQADETHAVRGRRRQAVAEAIERRPPGTDAEPVDAAAQLEAFDKIRTGLETVRRGTGRPQVAFDVSVHAASPPSRRRTTTATTGRHPAPGRRCSPSGTGRAG